ncbi:phosphoribosylglycinamide formyltransferase [Candidatus Marinamargulisbacteria bacterium SCGC AG-343-D04]|nr:phosphoribosylglycinamide formyltransferase [Candidatus Marinamargulisbacteria bacterium SCGC AG-343-D04]
MSLGILISGRGSNMDAIIAATKTHALDATVAVVISDNPNAEGIKKAKKQGVVTFGLNVNDFASKKEYEEDVVKILKGHGVDLLCLAGYMRIVGDTLLTEFENKIINIHPSLLPAFRGLNPQKKALESGVKYAGCTVHYVTNILDGGPIIDQDIVAIIENDTEKTLSDRILEKEHGLYPRAIQKVIQSTATKKGEIA